MSNKQSGVDRFSNQQEIIKQLQEKVKNLKEENRKCKDRKTYGLVWENEKNKEKIVEDCKNKLPILKRAKEKEIITDKSLPMNLMIEGDNYHALSCLNYTHKGKIDVIYIDPPYNTGKNEWKYNDKYVDKEDKYRHSKWLSMIEKRLTLSKGLLRQDGLILISIDDNEQAQLKLLCDNIFGEINRLSIHHIQVRYGNKSLNEKKDFQELLEYVLIYTRDKNYFKANRSIGQYDASKFNFEIKELKQPDKSLVINCKKVDIFFKNSYSIVKKKLSDVELFKETWISGSIYSGTGHGKMYQKVIENRTNIDGLSTLYKIYDLGEDGLGFRYMSNPKKISAKRGRMFTKIPLERKKEYLKGNAEVHRPILNYYDYSPDFGNIRHEGGVGFNSGKKPVVMLKHLINYHKNKNATVLDFFAGSGSTGHATLKLNQEDKGKRIFILCTNNENDIAKEKCYKRIKNVICGHSTTLGLGGNLHYFKADENSFVSVDTIRKVNDAKKLELTLHAGELIAIKENIFDQKEYSEYYQIFENTNKQVAIYFQEDKKELRSLLKKLNSKKEAIVYLFSWGKNTLCGDDFGYFDILIKDIPQPIIEVYKEING